MATIPELPLFTSGPLKSGTLNRLRDVVAFWQNPPAANMRASSSQNITSGGAYQIVTFHTTEYDTDTMVTSTTRLTAKTAGRFRVAATATFSANGTGDRYVLIRKNAGGSPTGGTQVISATAKPSSGSSCTVSTNSALEIQLSVNDTIEVFVFQDSGSTLTLNSSPGDTFVTMRLVSATASLSGTAATNLTDLLGESALGTSDLDTILQPGFYLQGTAADATLARHYPVATVAGHLQVYANGDASPASCTQIFETTANAVYVRHRATTTWSAWTQLGAGGGGSTVKNWAPGSYGLPGCTIIGGGAGAMGALAANTTYFAPFHLDAAGTITALTIAVNTAAGAGGLARLGIFSINASGLEASHTLVLDAGTVATDSTGTKEIVVSQALAAGWYALAVMTNAGTPTLYCMNVGADLFGGTHRLSTDGFMVKRTLSVATTFGAYPSNLTPAFSVGWDPVSGNTAVGLVKAT